MSTHHLPRWLFLRLLGVVHLVAFTSFWVQLEGLIGEQGLAPAADRLARLDTHHTAAGEWLWANAPTLAWLSSADWMLHTVCTLGLVAGLLVVLNLVPRIALGLGWLCYLSLFTVARPFLGYQWDILLLEATFLAIFLAPPGWRPRLGSEPAPPPVAVWAVRLLLFKLMFSSGVVKLTSGDPTWRDLTALDYHYWSQPLPHGAAWYAHNMPEWFRRLSVQTTFVVELLAPFLIFFNPRSWGLAIWLGLTALVVGLADDPFTPGTVFMLVLAAGWLDDRVVRRAAPGLTVAPNQSRLAAFWAFLVLMVGISATGNYGFFQLLTVALCVMLLDDGALNRLVPARFKRLPSQNSHWVPRAQHIAAWGAAAVFIVGSLARMVPLVGRERVRDALVATEAEAGTLGDSLIATGIQLAEPINNTLGPFVVANGYGLFASVTTRRYELIVEGTRDGQTWAPYHFHYKPDDVAEAPPVVGVHMPRLDWQLWFSALRPRCGREAWFMTFLERLLQHDPVTLGLIAEAPFAQAPTQIRVRRADYRFTDAKTRDETGALWQVKDATPYCPPLSLADFERRR